MYVVVTFGCTLSFHPYVILYVPFVWDWNLARTVAMGSKGCLLLWRARTMTGKGTCAGRGGGRRVLFHTTCPCSVRRVPPRVVWVRAVKVTERGTGVVTTVPGHLPSSVEA